MRMKCDSRMSLRVLIGDVCSIPTEIIEIWKSLLTGFNRLHMIM